MTAVTTPCKETQPSGSDGANIRLLPAIHQFSYDQENQLLYQVKTRQFPAISDTLNRLLGYTLISGHHNLLNSTQRIREFYSVLTRALIEAGATEQVFDNFAHLYLRTQQFPITYEELCEAAEQMAGFFLQSIRNTGTQPARQRAVSQAKGYMARHYASRITLTETAAYVHLNPSYFSSVFKAICRYSFKEYLNRIRIRESQLLLQNSSYDMIDIAIATGFEDQSYFTKTFKKITGITPGQFRSHHTI